MAAQQELALLRTSARMASIGQPALIPHPTVVACTSIRVTWARSIGTTVRTASPFVLPQKINNTFGIKQMIMYVSLIKIISQYEIA